MTYAVAQRLRPRRPTRSPRATSARCSTAGCCRGSRRRPLAVTEALDGYEPLAAATAIAALVDDVSNWYVRRSRRRFWRTDPDAPRSDTLAAHATLHEVLDRVAVLLAPLCPFLADHLFAGLRDTGADASVHLVDWPIADHRAIDEGLEAQMAVGPRARLPRARRPCRRRRRGSASRSGAPSSSSPLAPCGRREASSRTSSTSTASSTPTSSPTSSPTSCTRTSRRSARDSGSGPRASDAALGALDPVAAARALEAGESLVVRLGDDDVELTGEDVELRVRAEAGFAISREGAFVVALDLELDDALRRRGVVRELVRQVQELRKERGFEVADHIELWIEGLELDDDERAAVAREVLADAVHAGPGPASPAHVELAEGISVTVWLALLG